MKRYYLLQTDNNYMKHTLVTVLSVLKHAPDEEESVFYIIDDHLDQENKDFAHRFSLRYACEMIFLDELLFVFYSALRALPKSGFLLGCLSNPWIQSEQV